MKIRSIAAVLLTAFTFVVGTNMGAFAAQPTPKGIGFQDSVTEIMDMITAFEVLTLWIIIPISIFVLVLLIYVALRYNKKANPNPSKNSHNTLIEVIWTAAPILILLVLVLPSYKLLNAQFTPPEEPSVTIKAVGYQWYWGYEYQTENELSFDSLMLKEDEREAAGKTDKAAYPRLLAVDNELVVPVGKVVRLIVTSDPSGVNHAFAIPAFGIKIDAIPGRNNETWFQAREEGMYYGQCSELCGRDHAFMPIAIRVVSEDKYEAWLAAAADDVSAANSALTASIQTNPATQVAQK